MGKPVVHFEIHGKNSEGLFRFYAEIFGWTVDADNPLKYGMVETQAGKGIAGGMCASEMGPTVLVYIEVEDPQAYLDRIEAAGGTTVLPVTERSEEHTSELQSLMRNSYAVFCLKKKK